MMNNPSPLTLSLTTTRIKLPVISVYFLCSCCGMAGLVVVSMWQTASFSFWFSVCHKPAMSILDQPSSSQSLSATTTAIQQLQELTASTSHQICPNDNDDTRFVPNSVPVPTQTMHKYNYHHYHHLPLTTIPNWIHQTAPSRCVPSMVYRATQQWTRTSGAHFWLGHGNRTRSDNRTHAPSNNLAYFFHDQTAILRLLGQPSSSVDFPQLKLLLSSPGCRLATQPGWVVHYV